MNRVVKPIFALLYTLSVFIFLAVFYKGHLHNAEFSRMFLFSADYLTEALSHPGGFGIYILDFILQFCHIPLIGAALIALLLLSDSVLLYKRCRSESVIAYMISFLPATVVMLFVCLYGGKSMFSILLSPVIMLGSLSAAGIFARKKWLSSVLAVPVVFYLFGPLSFIYVFANINDQKVKTVISSFIVYLICLTASYFLFNHQISASLTGIYVWSNAGFKYNLLFRALPPLVAIAVILLPSFYENPPKGFLSFTFVLCYGALAAVLAFCSVPKVERVLRYDSMLHSENWNGILKMASKHKPSYYEECCCVYLALAMKGRLADELFNYPQGGPMAMVPSYSNSISPLYTAEVLRHVGLLPIAQRFVFEAQAGEKDSETNALCHKMLAEINAGLGFDAVAQKYADGLSRTLFYHKWAKNFDASLRQDCVSDSLGVNLFYIDGNFGDAIAYCIGKNPDFAIAREYMLCWYILAKDLDSFAQMFNPNEYNTVPKIYLDAYTLYWAQGHDDFSHAPDFISQSEIAEISDFAQTRTKGREAVKKKYGKTCWYYMFYNNPQAK